MILKEFAKDKLKISVCDSREDMGRRTAAEIADALKRLLSVKDEVNVIFAAAPSQRDVLFSLAADKSIDFGRVNAYHMDEYIGLSEAAPQLFSRFLDEHIWSKAKFKSVNRIDTKAAPEAECKRYSELLRSAGIDITLLGIGENGHIAFNDPHEADFNDPLTVKVVTLDELCRMQQVHDGCFASLSDVPKTAITLTIPALMSAEYKFCAVPTSTKAWAVENTVNGKIGEWCPATVMRKSDGCRMFTDADSGKSLL